MSGTQVLLTSLSRRRASEEAHDQLRSKILSGEIPAGTRLFEVTYARDLGISQSTLREALARLAHEGLVLNVPRRGTYVASLPVDTVRLATYVPRRGTLRTRPSWARRASASLNVLWLMPRSRAYVTSNSLVPAGISPLRILLRSWR